MAGGEKKFQKKFVEEKSDEIHFGTPLDSGFASKELHFSLLFAKESFANANKQSRSRFSKAAMIYYFRFEFSHFSHFAKEPAEQTELDHSRVTRLLELLADHRTRSQRIAVRIAANCAKCFPADG